jgi:hypothetical protein
MRIVIEIRPHGSCWKVSEAPGVEPIFPTKEHAIHYALAGSQAGEIRVLDSKGTVEKVIPFSKS